MIQSNSSKEKAIQFLHLFTSEVLRWTAVAFCLLSSHCPGTIDISLQAWIPLIEARQQRSKIQRQLSPLDVLWPCDHFRRSHYRSVTVKWAHHSCQNQITKNVSTGIFVWRVHVCKSCRCPGREIPKGKRGANSNTTEHCCFKGTSPVETNQPQETEHPNDQMTKHKQIASWDKTMHKIKIVLFMTYLLMNSWALGAINPG